MHARVVRRDEPIIEYIEGPAPAEDSSLPADDGWEESGSRRRVLIVAHRTAATPGLVEAVALRAARGPCEFTLLVPRPYWDPDTEEAAIVLELAVPLLERAAGRPVAGLIGDADPLVAIEDALAASAYDEVIISTLPERVSRWLRRDLPRRVQQLGLPVTVVTAPGRR